MRKKHRDSGVWIFISVLLSHQSQKKIQWLNWETKIYVFFPGTGVISLLLEIPRSRTLDSYNNDCFRQILVIKTCGLQLHLHNHRVYSSESQATYISSSIKSVERHFRSPSVACVCTYYDLRNRT